MFTTSNKRSAVFEKSGVYTTMGYMDVEASFDLRLVFTEPSVAYAVGARVVPEGSPLKAALPQPEKYQVIYAFSEDGCKAKVTWEISTSVNPPEEAS